MKEKLEKSTSKLDEVVEKLRRSQDSKMEGDVYVLANIEKIKYLLSQVDPKDHHRKVFNLLCEADLDYDEKRIAKILTKNLILSRQTITVLCWAYLAIIFVISYFVFHFLNVYSTLVPSL